MAPTDLPKPTIVLIHGAANSASVWTYWQELLALHGWKTAAVNLRGHGGASSVDLTAVTMEDYASDVSRVIAGLSLKPVVMGWSMGGLVAMMLAAKGEAGACVALAPSLPALQEDPRCALQPGVFGPEVYGIASLDPGDQPAMPDLDREERQVALSSLGPESLLARSERRRGVLIPEIPCPFLLVTGTLDAQWPEKAYADLWLKHERLAMQASHWGLVLNRRAIRTVLPSLHEWLHRSSGKNPGPHP